MIQDLSTHSYIWTPCTKVDTDIDISTVSSFYAFVNLST